MKELVQNTNSFINSQGPLNSSSQQEIHSQINYVAH